MSVFMLCEQAVGLVRGKRLILSADEKSMLEALNYEGLTELHSQDEAVVCALHFARVRDRLLQLYAWTFARKTATVEVGGSLPADVMNILCVLVDGVPVDYEITAGRLNTTARAEIHYTGKIIDTDQWSGIFRDVFVYSLAIEICSAVTGKPEYTQLLEQKAQELIQRAQQIGDIKSETRLTLKEEIYNRAVILSRGQRTLKESSIAASTQGTDNAGLLNDRMTAEYQVCERSGESVRNRLLELYPWVFARKSAGLSTTVSPSGGWSYGYKLPAECLKVLAVIGNGNALEYEQTGSNVYTNETAQTVIYTGIIENAGEWAGTFRDLFTYQLAIEVVYATSGNAEIIQLLEQKSLQVIQFAYNSGVIQNETKLPASEELYGRAISLAHGAEDKTEDITSRNAREYAVCRRSAGYIRDRLLQIYAWAFARKTANVTAGGTLPNDCLNVLCVIADDVPIDYEITGGKLNTSTDTEVHYTAKITDISKWSAIFQDIFVYSLASEICVSVTGNLDSATMLEQKAQELIQRAHQIGAIQTETRITLKQELFNRAIGLSRGYRILKTTGDTALSQGTDNSGIPEWRSGAEIKACLRAYEGVRDRLLAAYPWAFARKMAFIHNCGELPADMLTMLAVFVDGKPEDWEIVSDGWDIEQKCEIRYTARVEKPEEWDTVFREVFVYSLGAEICLAVTGNLDGASILEQKAQELIQRAYQIGAIRAETRVVFRQEIFNRAIGLVRGQRTQKTTGEAATVQGADNSGYPNDRMQAEADACYLSYESVRDRLLKSYAWKFAMKTTAPPKRAHSTAGWRFTYELPEDCLKVWNVITGSDNHGCFGYGAEFEIRDWETCGNELYSNCGAVNIRYVRKITDLEELAPEFIDVYVYLLASEVALNVTGSAKISQYFEQKAGILIEDMHVSGLINERTGLPFHKEKRFSGRQYLDYSGIPTLGGMSCESRTDKFCGW